MSKTYLYIQFKVKETDAFKEYGEKVSATVTQFGGKTIAVNKTPAPLNGKLDADVCVIQEWPSIGAAQSWLNSPEYAPLKKLRDERAMIDLIITEVPAIG